jgi:hypothetical protein
MFPVTQECNSGSRNKNFRFVSLAQTLIEQALESAKNLFIWSTTPPYLMLWWSVKKLKNEQTEQEINSEVHDEVQPQVDANPLMDFVDKNAGIDGGQPTYQDTMRSVGEQDAPFAEWAKRPILIRTIDWGTSIVLDDTFNPWSLYFGNSYVQSRFNNFSLAKATLKLKIVMNGNPFLYGRAMFDYLPLHTNAEMVLNRPLIPADTVEASQRPNVVINPNVSEGGEFTLPMFTPANFVSLTDGSLGKMGQITVRQINPLKHALGKSMSLKMQVFAWCEDLELMVPTRNQIINGEYDKDGSDTKPSNVLETVGKVALKVGEVATRASMALAMVGFSKPRHLDVTPTRNAPTFNTATMNGKSFASTLGLDQKNELSVAPQICGVDGDVDELDLRYIASKESYIGSIKWEQSATAMLNSGDISRIIVDPFAIVRNGGEYHLSAMAFASFPFLHWRGGLKYRFDVVCSPYHRGRMRVTYDPCKHTSSVVYNDPTAQSIVVDISEHTDFSITVGYSQPEGFREVGGPSVGDAIATHGGWGPAAKYGNGILTLSVVTPLMSPDDTIDNDIFINVYASACDDFALGNPTSRFQRYLPAGRCDIRTDISEYTMAKNEEPEEQVVNGEQDTPVGDGTSVICHFGLPLGSASDYATIHFGESITSFRQLMKRYSLHEETRLLPFESSTLTSDWTQGDSVYAVKARPAFPVLGATVHLDDAGSYAVLNTNKTGPVGPPFTMKALVVGADSIFEFYALQTITNYVTQAFTGWRGTNRWMVRNPPICKAVKFAGDGTAAGSVTQHVTVPTGHYPTTQIVRSPNNVFYNGWHHTPKMTAPADPNNTLADPFRTLIREYTLADNTYDFGCMEGCNLATQSNEIVEFEVPFYSSFRFSPAKTVAAGSKDTGSYFPQQYYTNNGSWVMRTEVYDADTNRHLNQSTYHCIGEDFQVYWYTGPPVLQFYSWWAA